MKKKIWKLVNEELLNQYSNEENLRRSLRSRNLPKKLNDYEVYFLQVQVHFVDNGDLWRKNSSGENIKKSLRSRNLSKKLKEYEIYFVQVDKTVYIEDNIAYTSIIEYNEPEAFEQALNSPDAEHWILAMEKEINCINKNQTWKLHPRPTNKNVISCKWVFKRKLLPNDQLIYKARLVARGFNPIQGIVYNSTYSPVVRYTTLRLLLALTVRKNYDIIHLDVECAYLQGDLEEDIYMEQPKGFGIKGHKDKVLKLNKAIYGLKQGGRAWNNKINKKFLELGFKKSQFDPCVYYLIHQAITIYLALFVDDIICMSNSTSALNQLKSKLSTFFPIKDLGDLTRCFGINVTRDRKKGILTLDQEDYITSSIQRFMDQDCNATLIPMDPNMVTVFDQELENSTSDNSIHEEEKDKYPYQQAIGTLMYLLQGTRPHLAFAISTLSKYNKNHTKTHWDAVKKVFRYLQGTKHLKLNFKQNNEIDLIGYGDASWGSEWDGRSVTGYLFKLQGAAISWRCQRQAVTELSTCDAEHQALTATIQEAIWLRGLLNELLPNFKSPIPVMCDNTSTINFSKNQNYSHRTKHIIIKRGFAKDSIELGQVIINYCSTINMIADALTKALNKIKLKQFIEAMGLK